MTTITEQAWATVRREARKIAGLNHEHLVAIDPITGEVTDRVCGEDESVGLEAERQQGKVVLHNHPAAQSFSPQDFVAASASNVAAGVVVDPTGQMYRMLPGSSGWMNPLLVHLLAYGPVAEQWMQVFSDPTMASRMNDRACPILQGVTHQMAEQFARLISVDYHRWELVDEEVPEHADDYAEGSHLNPWYCNREEAAHA